MKSLIFILALIVSGCTTPATTIVWQNKSGYSPAHTIYGFAGTNDNSTRYIELGIRSDGVIVWRDAK